MVIVLRSIHRVENYTHLEREKPLKCLNTFVMIVFVYMFAQREYDLYFYVKRDCLLLSVNVRPKEARPLRTRMTARRDNVTLSDA